MNKTRALFLDRDGIINKLIDNRPQWNLVEIKIFDHIKEIVAFSKKLNYLPVVVTNQPDAGRGKLTFELLHEINRNICKKVNINHFYICDHPYDGICECRKPKPGMLFKASKENNINLIESLMIGDRQKDIQAGKSAGCKTISLSECDLGADFYVKNHEQLFSLLKNVLNKKLKI